MSFRAATLRLSCLGLCAAIAAAPAFADIKAVERTFLERAAISAADRSCNLFSEGERLALKSGLYQAEGELLRANYARRQIDQLATRVGEHARSLGCDHPSVADVAATIRSSYRQFAKTAYLEYPTDRGIWGASRNIHDAWAVSKSDPGTGATFGLRRSKTSEQPRFAVAIKPTGPMPSAGKLIVRDTRKLLDPWFGSAISKASALTPPPRSVSRIEWAGERGLEQTVTGDYIQVFYFPVETLEALEALDPREGVTVEITPSPRAADQTPFRITFEIGDFRAARAFAMIPPPEYRAQTAAAAPAKAH